MDLIKRTWWYLQTPSHFEVAPCTCGNHHTVWSEYKAHVWCPVCEIDFIPAHNGIFDGPIAVGAATMMGISFDRYNDELKCVERFDTDTGEYTRQIFSGMT